MFRLKQHHRFIFLGSHFGSFCYIQQTVLDNSSISNRILTDSRVYRPSLMVHFTLLQKAIRGDILHETTCYESLISQFSLSAAIKLQGDKELTKENE